MIVSRYDHPPYTPNHGVTRCLQTPSNIFRTCEGGHDTPMNPDDVFASTSLAADVALAITGDTGATVRVGYRYLTGSAGVIDIVEARRYFGLVAARCRGASAWLAYIDIRQTDDERLLRGGVDQLQNTAAAGNAMGQTLLGRVYERGLGGCHADPAQAVTLYRAAAPRFSLAKTYLGQALRNAHKHREAIALFEEAAVAGETNAMLELAVLHVRSRGGRPQIVEAKRLLRMASERGGRLAQYRLAAMYRDGIGGASAGAPHRAFNLFHLSARLGYRPAQVALAAAYASGAGVAANPRLAACWLEKLRRDHHRR